MVDFRRVTPTQFRWLSAGVLLAGLVVPAVVLLPFSGSLSTSSAETLFFGGLLVSLVAIGYGQSWWLRSRWFGLPDADDRFDRRDGSSAGVAELFGRRPPAIDGRVDGRPVTVATVNDRFGEGDLLTSAEIATQVTAPFDAGGREFGLIHESERDDSTTLVRELDDPDLERVLADQVREAASNVWAFDRISVEVSDHVAAAVDDQTGVVAVQTDGMVLAPEWRSDHAELAARIATAVETTLGDDADPERVATEKR